MFSCHHHFGSESLVGDYGHNAGGEINLRTPNGKWAGQAGYIHSFKQGFSSDNRHIYSRFDYSGGLIHISEVKIPWFH